MTRESSRRFVRFASMTRAAAPRGQEKRPKALEAAVSPDPFVRRLDEAAAPGTSGQQFLANLSPIHADWHSSPRTIGFLLFHWEVIQRFRATQADAVLGGITPFSLSELEQYNAAYDVEASITEGDTGSLMNFSLDEERWHNDAHMNIGMALGENLMDPRTNIFYADFWRLHYFINDQFEHAILLFKPGAPSSVPSTIQSLESTDAMPFI